MGVWRVKTFIEFYLQDKDMSHCNCDAPKGFSCKAHCKAKCKVSRTGGKHKGKKVKSKKYGGSA